MNIKLPSLALIALALLTGCGKSDSGSKIDASAAMKKGSIGVTLLSLQNPFFKVIGDNIAAEAAKVG
ncbi:MAG TPA: sugar ABC transporter substrate-binding protein, partial [Verrucomicrobiae bacterium]